MFVSNQNSRGAPPSRRHGMNPYVFGQHQRSSHVPRSLPHNIQEKLSVNFLQNPNIGKGLDSFQKGLGHLQQVLKLVETTTPFIQEYGPMIKNLPAMYRMMKAFKNIDALTDDTKEEAENETEGEKEEEKQVVTTPKDTADSENKKKVPSKKVGISTPKLYI